MWLLALRQWNLDCISLCEGWALHSLDNAKSEEQKRRHNKPTWVWAWIEYAGTGFAWVTQVGTEMLNV